MTLRKKIILGFAVLLSLSLLVSGYIFLALEERRQVRAVEIRSTQAAEAALLLDIDVLRVVVLLQQYLDTRDDTKLQDLLRSQAAAKQHMAAVKESTSLPIVRHELAAYERILPVRAELATELIEGVKSGQSLEQLQAIKQERGRLDDQARKHLRAIVDAEKAALRASVTSGRIAYERFAENLIVALLAYVAAVAVIATVLGRELSGSLRQLISMADSVGKGKLDIRNNIKRKDEIGTLATTLNKMAEELRKLDNAKEDFISIGTHQLRTPATAVKQYLGLLREEYAGILEPQQKKIIESAYTSNERQLTTIDDLLNVTQLTAGTMTLRKKRTDIKKFLRRLVDDYRPTARDRHQRLTLSMPKGQLFAVVDEQRLRMAIENILDNASKYTPEKGKVMVRLEKQADTFSVEIKDTGVGISQKDMPRLFQRLSRIPNKLSHVGGTGLGLYLAQQLVDLHGGRIDVDSAEGSGTVFSILIPRR